MPRHPTARTRSIPVVAQDPSVIFDGRVLVGNAVIPTERMDTGPWGARARVIDFDVSTGRRYEAVAPFCKIDDGGADPDELRADVGFHQHNTYAVAMSVLERFERALGRRVPWGFDGHTICLSPHAFQDANACYAPNQGALLFGYFRDPRPDHGLPVFTCLCHDIVAHETVHALLDGLRPHFSVPSSTDQAAFHEGFADVIALLSVFAQPGVVTRGLGSIAGDTGTVASADLTRDALRQSFLLRIGEEMGQALGAVRGDALRASALLRPEEVDLESPAFDEPHRRGEVFVAAVMNAFLEVWLRRLKPLLRHPSVDQGRVVEEGSKAADRLLTILIRAIDYTPPIELTFGDYLSAAISADAELWPDDTTYGFRDVLRASFGVYKIPPSSGGVAEAGAWEPPPSLDYSGVHAGALRTDPNEVYRFLWQNHDALGLAEPARRDVVSVRPTVRVGIDGFVLHETVAEVVESLTLRADELPSVGLTIPAGMPPDLEVTLLAGRTLIFDEFSRLRYDVGNGLFSATQDARLRRMWRAGLLVGDLRAHAAAFFRNLHLHRRLRGSGSTAEGW